MHIFYLFLSFINSFCFCLKFTLTLYKINLIQFVVSVYLHSTSNVYGDDAPFPVFVIFKMSCYYVTLVNCFIILDLLKKLKQKSVDNILRNKITYFNIVIIITLMKTSLGIDHVGLFTVV